MNVIITHVLGGCVSAEQPRVSVYKLSQKEIL